ncbi:hypothetical protein QZH41_010603 [Actinostola sp. cb2023]|nr:hypothetical protein QZH41_010603 [Actinostola sp. cb2023]
MSSSSRLKVSDGDWVCGDENCANVNFARRTSCNRCGKGKGKVKAKVDTIKLSGMKVGRQGASKSGGLFSEEDWICSKCGNVNWARRNQCNMCNNLKFSKVEARTGHGGGYNERGTVEYKEKVPSDDDEFDDVCNITLYRM